MATPNYPSIDDKYVASQVDKARPTKRRVNLLNVDKLTDAQEKLFRRFGALHKYDEDTKFWTLGDAYYITNELIVQFDTNDSVHVIDSAKGICDEIISALRADHSDIANKCGHVVIGLSVMNALKKDVMFEHVLGLDNVDRMGYDHVYKLYDLIRKVRQEYINQKDVNTDTISDSDLNDLDVLALNYILTTIPRVLAQAIDHNNRHLIADCGDMVQKIAEILAPSVIPHIKEAIMDARSMYYEEKKHQLNYDGYANLDDDTEEGEGAIDPTRPINPPGLDNDDDQRNVYISDLMKRAKGYKFGNRQ
jgi:hypothetical protein